MPNVTLFKYLYTLKFITFPSENHLCYSTRRPPYPTEQLTLFKCFENLSGVKIVLVRNSRLILVLGNVDV